MSCPYWKALRRRVKDVDWSAVALAVTVVVFLTVVMLLWGDRTLVEKDLLP